MVRKLPLEYFVECWYFTTFKLPYFGSAWAYSQMFGHTGSPTCIVHADVTLTQSKFKVTGLLTWKLRKLCVLAAMTVIPLWGFLVETTRESLSTCIHRWKISEFLRKRVSTSPKQPKIWYCNAVCFYAPTSSNSTIPGNRNHLGSWSTYQGCAFCTWVLL